MFTGSNRRDPLLTVQRYTEVDTLVTACVSTEGVGKGVAHRMQVDGVCRGTLIASLRIRNRFAKP